LTAGIALALLALIGGIALIIGCSLLALTARARVRYRDDGYSR
jgi:hypothetical protein